MINLIKKYLELEELIDLYDYKCNHKERDLYFYLNIYGCGKKYYKCHVSFNQLLYDDLIRINLYKYNKIILVPIYDILVKNEVGMKVKFFISEKNKNKIGDDFDNERFKNKTIPSSPDGLF